VDADEMEKVFNAAFNRFIAGTNLPGAPGPTGASASTAYDASTPMDEDDRIPAKGKNGRKLIVSDDEYLTTPSDDE